MNTTADSAKWQFTDDIERRQAIEAEAEAQARAAEAEAEKSSIDLWPLAWGAFGCCCVICYTVLKIYGL
jgi:hypothetical protein